MLNSVAKASYVNNHNITNWGDNPSPVNQKMKTCTLKLLHKALTMAISRVCIALPVS